jgi:hypothetical protein
LLVDERIRIRFQIRIRTIEVFTDPDPRRTKTYGSGTLFLTINDPTISRPVDHGVGVKSDDEIGAERLGLLQEVQVAHVKEIKGSRHVDNLIRGLGPLLVGELENLLGGGQELAQARPGGPGAGVRAHVA